MYFPYYTAVSVTGKGESIKRLTTPVGWHMSLQFPVLSQTATIVYGTLLICIYEFHINTMYCMYGGVRHIAESDCRSATVVCVPR